MKPKFRKLTPFFLSFLLLISSFPAFAQLTTPIPWMSDLPGSCVPTNRARVLVYKNTAPTGLYQCTAGVYAPVASGAVSLSSTFGNSLATAITAIGAIPARMLVDASTTCSAAHVFPSTLKLEFTNSAKITESGTCTLTFQGVGLRNPELPVAVFSGFEAGDVTFTGATADLRPAALASELWDTGNNSVTDRLDRADKAISASYFVKLVVYPRMIDSRVLFRTNREIYFTAGEYLNDQTRQGTSTDTGATTDGWFYVAPFALNNYTTFHGTRSARLHQPETGAGGRMVEINGDLTLSYESIVVENLSFIGGAAIGSAAGSCVILGNVKNGAIRNNLFYRTIEYTAVLGGYGTSSNYAENSQITGNTFVGIGTQVLVLLNGKNIRMADNFVDSRGANGTSTYTIIDIEPNAVGDRVENLIIENNIIDARDVPSPAKNSLAILVQGTDHGGNKNVTIRNNTIYSSNLIASDGADETQEGPGGMLYGIAVGNTEELYIYGNTIRGGAWVPLGVGTSRDARIYDNDIILGYHGNHPTGQIRLDSCASCDVWGNRISNTTMTSMAGYVGQATNLSRIYESDIHIPVTVAGTAVTIKLFSAGGGNIQRAARHFKDLNVLLNDSIYTISTAPDSFSLTLGSSAGTIPQSTFTSANVTAGTDSINIVGHGFVTGAKVTIWSSGTLPAHTAPTVDPTAEKAIYYVIRIDNDNFKLAASRALAVAGTAIDLTNGGRGMHTITAFLQLAFSSNTYSGNKTPDGIRLEPTGTSYILSTADDNKTTAVADTNYTATSNSGLILYSTLTASRTVSLPDATTIEGKIIQIKDGAGAATAFDIVLDPVVAGQTVDGAARVVINVDWGFKKLKARAGNWITIP